MEKRPETVNYRSDSGKDYKIHIAWQEGDYDVGISEGFFFTIDGLDCDETDMGQDRDECLGYAQNFIKNMEFDAENEESEDDEE